VVIQAAQRQQTGVSLEDQSYVAVFTGAGRSGELIGAGPAPPQLVDEISERAGCVNRGKIPERALRRQVLDYLLQQRHALGLSDNADRRVR
jgi:hypothetical protein